MQEFFLNLLAVKAVTLLQVPILFFIMLVSIEKM
jgi:hypothetical protein